MTHAAWWLPAVSVAERAMVVPFHIACSVLVAYGVRRGQLRWTWLAVLVHTVLDAAAVYLRPTLLWAELSLLGVTVLLVLGVSKLPRLRAAESQRSSNGVLNTISGVAGTFSQEFASISSSSCPASQPA